MSSEMVCSVGTPYEMAGVFAHHLTVDLLLGLRGRPFRHHCLLLAVPDMESVLPQSRVARSTQIVCETTRSSTCRTDSKRIPHRSKPPAKTTSALSDRISPSIALSATVQFNKDTHFCFASPSIFHRRSPNISLPLSRSIFANGRTHLRELFSKEWIFPCQSSSWSWWWTPLPSEDVSHQTAFSNNPSRCSHARD